jgi:hypothetical protein
VLALALSCAGAATAGAQAQAPAGPQQPMLEQMRARREKLDGLVAKMNAATGEAKVDAIAAVVTELVAQHNAMPHMRGGMGMGMGGGPMMQQRQQQQQQGQ